MDITIEVGPKVFQLLDCVDELMGLVEVDHVNDAYALRTEINNILGDMVVVN